MNPTKKHLFRTLIREMTGDQRRRLYTVIEEIKTGSGTARANLGVLMISLENAGLSSQPSPPAGPSSADSQSGPSLPSSESPSSEETETGLTPSTPHKPPSSPDEDDSTEKGTPDEA